MVVCHSQVLVNIYYYTCHNRLKQIGDKHIKVTDLNTSIYRYFTYLIIMFIIQITFFRVFFTYATFKFF